MTTTYQTWKQAAEATPKDKVPSDGHTTCLWHRQHEHYIKHIVPLLPKCDICGGTGHPRQPRHALCVEYQKRDMPAPRLDTIRDCPCSKCRPERV